ncbi:sensor domain-containing diguanylate cyclase [Limisalsivibrio acetivorans]|uniref:sensor domain-containing diguanylate cyclase n=1 Tax=Limisalsivibrio acetivorans TaxID=1304888 RepID=UPI00047BF44D|nr:sensor domain-containing diguanylate cyclase [Limisalsivibrio acetivorans]
MSDFKNIHESLLENLYDGVYYVDMDMRITYWNRAAERITGYRRDEVLGKRCSDNILRHIDCRGVELCVEGCPLGETLKDGETREANVSLHHKAGYRLPVAVRISPMLDEAGNIAGAVEIFTDSSRQMDLLLEVEKLRDENVRDPLTGVGNRRYADIILNSKRDEYLRSSVPFGVLFIDIDHFKSVNDTWGHDTGDCVLEIVSSSMSYALREMDVLCRWGGEEFIAIIPNADDSVLGNVAERLRFSVEKSWLDMPDDSLLFVTVSIGGTIYRKGEELSDTLKRADDAMYSAKDSGRNCIKII